MNDIYQFEAETIDGNTQSFSHYQGKVLLIVNTASQCGFTSQYQGLQDLYKKYHKQGFEILAFPCNQFKQQEPASNREIQSFCETNFAISFSLFSKINVNGKNAHPLYQFLTSQAPGIFNTKRIKWNFTKFLVANHGKKVTRFSPTTTPQTLDHEIKQALAEN